MKVWYLLKSQNSVSRSISKVDLTVWIDLSVHIGLAKIMAKNGQECTVIMFLINLPQLYFQSKKKRVMVVVVIVFDFELKNE